MFSLTVSYIENPQYNIAMVAFLHGRSGNRERERERELGVNLNSMLKEV